jgi:hypothetical protein
MAKRQRECDSRCWFAVSHESKCRCQCGGRNHGKGIAGQAMAFYSSAFPVCTPVRYVKEIAGEFPILQSPRVVDHRIINNVPSLRLLGEPDWIPASQVTGIREEDPDV